MPLPALLDLRMSQNLILLPVFAQVVLTWAVLVMMGRARGRSQKARGQTLDDLALATDKDWDTEAIKRANNFRNQFELPVLFYAVTAFALITRNIDVAFFVLACLFVATRIAHTAVHVGSNKVALRGGAYIVGFVVLVVMWSMLVWRVASAGF